MSIVTYVGSLFTLWINLFASPFYHDFRVLWIVIPLYINWIAAEIYLEKKGTSFGHAIFNGFVLLWVGIDWIRVSFELIHEVTKTSFVIRMLLAVAALVYGVTIVVSGIRLKKVAQYLGTIRQTTYLCLVLTPVIFGIVPFDFDTFFAILLFYPIFYYLFEVIFRAIPEPETYGEEELKSITEKAQARGFDLSSPIFSPKIIDLEPDELPLFMNKLNTVANLPDVCGYCGKPSEYVRITVDDFGKVHVFKVCHDCRLSKK